MPKPQLKSQSILNPSHKQMQTQIYDKFLHIWTLSVSIFSDQFLKVTPWTMRDLLIGEVRSSSSMQRATLKFNLSIAQLQNTVSLSNR